MRALGIRPRTFDRTETQAGQDMRMQNLIRNLIKNSFVHVILPGLGLAFGIFIVFVASHRLHEYNRLDGIAVSVIAEVTSVEESLDSEDGTEYKLYITYAYEGKVCSDIYYDTVSQSGWLGKTVTVQIDPENPEIIRPKSNGLFPLVLGALFIFFSGREMTAVAADRLSRADAMEICKKCYPGMLVTRRAVLQDLNFEVVQKRKYSLLLLCITVPILLTAIVLTVLYQCEIGTILSYGIPLGLIVWVSWCNIKQYPMDERQFEIRYDRIKEICENSDDEGGTTYTYHFEKGGKLSRTDDVMVSAKGKSLASMRQGDAVYTVAELKNGRTNILRVFDAREFRI